MKGVLGGHCTCSGNNDVTKDETLLQSVDDELII